MVTEGGWGWSRGVPLKMFWRGPAIEILTHVHTELCNLLYPLSDGSKPIPRIPSTPGPI